MRVILFICLFSVAQAFSQSEVKFAVFDGKGNPSSIEAIVNSLEKADVVFIGELHDDPVGHQVEFEIFKQVVEKYLSSRRVTLSLEMFERDVQTVIDEYLAGLIPENHFLLSSRPWGNYKTDYRPLVELAKEKKLDVVAATAPRRYVNMVSRNGRESLNLLSKQAKGWLAPLPYAEASEAYSKKFKALMGSSAEASMGLDKILSSQSLWDATMAHSIAMSLKKNKHSLVVHLNGGFHTENRLGIVEHLSRYRRKAKALVVTIRNADDPKTFDRAKHTDLGDFVILTAPKPKTQGGVLREVLKRMIDHWRSLTSVKAGVVMIKHNAQLNESDTYAGQVAYLRGGSRSDMRVRVDWMRPVSETFSMIGWKYAFYKPQVGQAILGDLNDSAKKSTSASSAFELLRMAGEQFKSNFDIVFLGEETVDENVRTWHLRLIPTNPTFFKATDLWIDVNGMVRKVMVNEHNGDTTSIQLSDIRKNVTIDPQTFNIVFPKSVRIIRW
ncbi:MAG TPA: ChaN family lipoprotein [Pyrinomonadaceae bacterium]|nr:ChaN family lipoprotein [Pyrinomonadaceae bacterium]